ncbi:hypothetical protein [Hyphomicrobium nitrativorans]|uniref:hypothetical protein n=1 Tax=Hyphomicrobium nitrativorans TaxID=1427356 RepID=UPI000A7A6C21|nr:hypothetical protein [Hyphomicrobium nitrativorans]
MTPWDRLRERAAHLVDRRVRLPWLLVETRRGGDGPGFAIEATAKRVSVCARIDLGYWDRCWLPPDDVRSENIDHRMGSASLGWAHVYWVFRAPGGDRRREELEGRAYRAVVKRISDAKRLSWRHDLVPLDFRA